MYSHEYALPDWRLLMKYETEEQAMTEFVVYVFEYPSYLFRVIKEE